MPSRHHSCCPGVPTLCKQSHSLYYHLFLTCSFQHVSFWGRGGVTFIFIFPNTSVLFFHFNCLIYSWLKAASTIHATVWVLDCLEISKTSFNSASLTKPQKATCHSVAWSLMSTVSTAKLPPKLPIISLCLQMLRLLAHILKISSVSPKNLF